MKSLLVSIMVAGLLAALGSAQSTSRYIVKDLGTFGGPKTNSAGLQLNNAGWVAGSSNYTPGGPQHAFLWYGAGLLRDLGTLDGLSCPECNSAAGGPNARGEAAIGSETSNPDPNGEDFCEYGTHLQCLAAIWKDGVMTPLLSLPGGNNANAFNLNNRGVVVGLSENGYLDPTCLDGGTPFQVTRFEAVTWGRDGKIRQLLSPLKTQTFTDTVAFALGINDNGETVGASGLCSNTAIPPNPIGPHAVMWEKDGTAVDLGSLPTFGHPKGQVNVADSINNRREVVGGAQSPLDGTIHTFHWTKETGMQDYGTFPGAILTVAPCCNSINNRGEMVGFSIDGTTFNSHAVIWQGNKPIYFDTFNPPDSPFSSLLTAYSINDSGEIVGQGLTKNGEFHAFMAIPR